MDHESVQTQRPQHPLANYQFSSEELRVLRECNTESFLQRSLPLGTGLGVIAYTGVQYGYLRPNVKFGAIPKVVVGVIIGYFLGKFSYQEKCAEKIMRLPNSKLAEVLRQRRQNNSWGSKDSEPNLGVGFSLAPFSSNVTDFYSDENRSSTLDLDTEIGSTVPKLDDTFRPSMDALSPYSEPDLPLEPSKHVLTYEELRFKNREEYAKKQNQFVPPLTADPPLRQQKILSKAIIDEEQERIYAKEKLNKYGDSWTD